MNKYYLGLGSNLGHRKENLEQAVFQLHESLSFKNLRVAPIYETPALLNSLKHTDWNLPFLNTVVEFESEIKTELLLELTQKIEAQLGRNKDQGAQKQWAPRSIDIDILLTADGREYKSNQLQIPHPGLEKRAFVLDPLKDLNPSLILPSGESVLTKARRQSHHSPLWMAVVNITPDSFSGGLQNTNDDEAQIQKNLLRLIDENIGIIDVGGESTRPGAVEISPEEEWKRIHPILEFLNKTLKEKNIRPRISVDSRHLFTLKKSLELGTDIINDVSGLADERIISLIRDSGCDYVLMHSLSVPADAKKVLSSDEEILEELLLWFQNKINLLKKNGVSQNQIIIDPGIGFGKTTLQSLFLLKNIEVFYSLNCRVMVGHSRKSFMNPFVNALPQERDIETLGMSLSLIQKGVDILRVHNYEIHKRAFQAWNHIQKD